MKHLAFVLLTLILVGCGGGSPASPVSVKPLLDDSVSIKSTTLFSLSMVGQRWTFQQGGCRTFLDVTAAPSLHVAGRDGNNVVWHYTKSDTPCYWAQGAPNAVLDFVLHQNPDVSWRSTASLISMPDGCPWCQGQTNIKTTFIIRDNQTGMPLPYEIIPPDLKGTQHIVLETEVTGDQFQGLDFSAEPLGLGNPNSGEFWRTEFYIEWLNVPGVFEGWAAVSEQWESTCGHEKWYFAPNLALIRVDSPNDGVNHSCGAGSKDSMTRVGA